jgi:adenine-specific DNA-methyltransferase
VRELLAPSGSIWVHCDDSEGAHLRVLMDELFPKQWVGTIIWQKRYSRDNRPAIGTVHDYIHVYSPMGGAWKHVRNRVPRATAKEYRNANRDPRGPWRPIPMDAQGFRKNQMYKITTPAGVVKKPPKGRCWSMLRERFDELLADGPQEPPSRLGRIYFGLDGRGMPNVIRYLDEDEGLVPWTWWPSEEVGHNDEAKKEQLGLHPDVEAFKTPKPERLMERILRIGSDPGDIVLDCFLGSATTAAVAQKLGRRWVGIERSAETLDGYAIPRLTQVIDGEDLGGITEVLGWQGGGPGFRILDVAPSMFADVGGIVLLADWATNGKLAEATSAQLHYDYEPDAPFCGRRGRRRLAVIDGLVNEGVVRLLASALGEGERLVVCGTAIDPAASAVLRELVPGSSARKIPASILSDYRQAAQWNPRTQSEPHDEPAAAADAPEVNAAASAPEAGGSAAVPLKQG